MWDAGVHCCRQSKNTHYPNPSLSSQQIPLKLDIFLAPQWLEEQRNYPTNYFQDISLAFPLWHLIHFQLVYPGLVLMSADRGIQTNNNNCATLGPIKMLKF